MGYYVRTTGSNFYVAQSKKNAAYEALCALNQRDDLKTGGSFGGNLSGDSPRPAGLDHHPSRWFSWMAADYPSKCKDLKQVLEEVGFDVVEDEAGNVTGLHYDSKTGHESLFLSALAPFVRDGSHIDWQGEEGEHFRYEFSGGRMLERDGRIVWA
jgi:hypothetical protein